MIQADPEAALAEADPGEETLDLVGAWLTGGDAADDLTGTDGDDSIFGDDGADTIEGGAGDDQLFSGNDHSFREDWNHYPGDLTRVDDAGDVLDGGAGNDELWMGQGTVATGGDGADVFHAFGATYPEGAEAAEITDFTAGEDQLEIDFPVHEGYYAQDFTTEDAVNGLLSSYDEDTDTTLIEIDGEEVVTLNGDQTGLSIAFHDNVSGGVEWQDIEGNPMTEEEGEAADIILCARALQDVIGEQS
ncbi:hypothetical protein IT775_03540 [Thalassobius aquimarinus]|uniref:Uncharacterized protein n=2 Tax=Thalassovita aquimarina TaxID=2785917 RepID=A0ABS5HMP7_9RHOB|nr:hypothetical protein [Thalassovita aquimarina]MBR9650198.1 hypothetical protein [Thalassovita aquimarina]